jgi:hypothetical protein
MSQQATVYQGHHSMCSSARTSADSQGGERQSAVNDHKSAQLKIVQIHHPPATISLDVALLPAG